MQRKGLHGKNRPVEAWAKPAVAFLALVLGCARGENAFDVDGGTVDSGSFARDAGPLQAPPGEVFGHSENTLFRIDTITERMDLVGVFQGCTYVADIALDENSTIYASTGTGLYIVETNTARCTRIAEGTFPNSLSFVPKGTVDPAAEALVGYDGGDYIRIDTTTGAITKIGAIGGGLVSSGDIVSVKDGPTYLTVKGTSACTSNDCLVEVDPKTGKMVKNWGSVGYSDVFGLAFWAGSIYGFSNDGELFEVTLTGGSLKTNTIPIPSKPANLSFWGAGSTTSAPVTPIPK